MNKDRCSRGAYFWIGSVIRSRSKKSLRRKSWTSARVSGPPMFSISIPVFGFLRKRKCSGWCVLLFPPRRNLGSASKLSSNLFDAEVKSCRPVRCHPTATCPGAHGASRSVRSQLRLWPSSRSSIHGTGPHQAQNVSLLNCQPWTKIPCFGDWVKLWCKIVLGRSTCSSECLMNTQVTWSLQTSGSSSVNRETTTCLKRIFWELNGECAQSLSMTGAHRKFYWTQRSLGFPYNCLPAHVSLWYLLFIRY